MTSFFKKINLELTFSGNVNLFFPEYLFLHVPQQWISFLQQVEKVKWNYTIVGQEANEVKIETETLGSTLWYSKQGQRCSYWTNRGLISGMKKAFTFTMIRTWVGPSKIIFWSVSRVSNNSRGTHNCWTLSSSAVHRDLSKWCIG